MWSATGDFTDIRKNQEFGVDGVYIHSLKVRNKEIHSLSDLNMKVNEFAKRIIFINK